MNEPMRKCRLCGYEGPKAEFNAYRCKAVIDCDQRWKNAQSSAALRHDLGHAMVLKENEVRAEDQAAEGSAA